MLVSSKWYLQAIATLSGSYILIDEHTAASILWAVGVSLAALLS